MDNSNGDPLIGATIWLQASNSGMTTDINGYFSVANSNWPTKIVISYIGYRSDTILLKTAASAESLEINLNSGMILNEVVVSNSRSNASKNYNSNAMSVIDLSMEEVRALPALLSENDVLKAVQLLPGIQSVEGAATGYYVRGGSSDQNLILLNDAVIYNPFHAAGFISIFNGDIVEDITIHKGAFPSSHGGRISSMLNVETRDPSLDKVSGSAGIGMVTARLTVDVPLVKDKLGLTVSGRGFYSYELAKAFLSDEVSQDLPTYYFYDAFAQMVWKPGLKDEVKAYYYQGKDQVAFQDVSTQDSAAFDIPWTNRATGLSWQHQFSDNVISRVSFYHSDYFFKFATDLASESRSLQTGISEFGGRLNINHKIWNHLLDYGFEIKHQSITPEVTRDVNGGQNNTVTRVADVRKRYTPIQFAAYINDDWNITENIGVNFGVRMPVFNDNSTTYLALNPQVVLKWKVHATGSIKASYSYSSQFIHLLVNSTATTPLDLWVSSSDVVKPQNGHSAVLGYFQNFADQKYEFSVEGYYKHLNNQIEYAEGIEVFSDSDIEQKLLFGKGWTAGAEFFIRKRTGKFTGFAGYTLSWAKRQFDELNGGKPFDYKYDRRHDLTISGTYNITDKWSVSALFVVGSGQALTVPTAYLYTPKGQGNGTFVYDYGDRNSYRLRPYHRMDLSIKYSGVKKRVQSHFKFDIYNLYNQKNSFFVLLDTRENDFGQNEIYLRDYSLIPITPSISYQMDF